MPSQFDEVLRVKRDGRGRAEPLNAEFFDIRFQSVDDRIATLEELRIAWQVALDVVQDRVLASSEAVIAGLRDRLVSITDLEWLTATSVTSRAFVEGQPASLVIVQADRPLFAPGPFAIVGRLGDPYAYAIVQTLAYDRVGGQWDTEVVAVVGDLSTSHSDWTIGAVAGSTLVQLAWLEEAKAARNAAEGFKTAAATSAGAAAGSAAAAGTSAAAAAGSATAAANSATAAAGSATSALNSAAAAAASAASIDMTALNAAIASKADASATAAAIAAKPSLSIVAALAGGDGVGSF